MVETQTVFIDAAKAAGIPHIVKLSGKESGIGFDAGRFQGTREHEEIERYLEASGPAWTHLRPSQFMNRYLPGALTGVDPARRELRLPIGDIRLSPVETEDIAKVAVGLLRSEGHEGKAYDMTGPEALSMKEAVEHISDATGADFRYVAVSLEDKLQEFRDRGVPEPAVRIVEQQLAERARHPESHVRLEAHRAFGVEPTGFAEFARRNAKAFLG
ncbi:NmrA family NAD(P)-binding protein [Actinoallomurus acaciae]|uniref:NmrA family NAD(P)-binding protein n=1 Tax=Actinoallomurus acaciae TaxID=502577 RepID=A0ABV5YA51_9ACTN